MKNIVRNPFIILLLVCLICTLLFFLFDKYQQSNEVYSSVSDKELAKVIETSILQAKSDKLNKYSLEMKLNNIDYVCYASSIYSVPVDNMLNSIDIKSAKANLIEYKKQTGNSEGSSVFILVKKNKELIPIFVSNYFYEFKTDLIFSENRCANVKSDELKIEIDSSPKDKALFIIE